MTIGAECRQQRLAAGRQYAVALEIAHESCEVSARSRAGRCLEQRTEQHAANSGALFPGDRIVVRPGGVGPRAPPLRQRAAPDTLAIVQPRQCLQDRAPACRRRVRKRGDEARDDRRFMNLLEHAQRAGGILVGWALHGRERRVDGGERDERIDRNIRDHRIAAGRERQHGRGRVRRTHSTESIDRFERDARIGVGQRPNEERLCGVGELTAAVCQGAKRKRSYCRIVAQRHERPMRFRTRELRQCEDRCHAPVRAFPKPPGARAG